MTVTVITMEYDGEHYEIDPIALLKYVVDYAMQPPDEAVADAQRRLGRMTEEVQRLRNKLREAQDVVGAQIAELAGLRSRAQTAEANVMRVTGRHPAASESRERQLKELAAIMRARPGAYAGNVDRNGGGR